jgi:hypothetical protein
MDLVKVYLIQIITAASNNLRLNAQQIEVVGLLRETIINSADIGSELLKMKKATELSKLAVRLGEIHTFLTQGVVDFSKISEQFREHSRYLLRDLNQFLENVNPNVFKEALNKISNNGNLESVDVELIDRRVMADQILDIKNDSTFPDGSARRSRTNISSILNFEEKILGQIKPADDLLKKILSGKATSMELENYSDIMKDHALLSEQSGFQVLAKMHNIIASAFNEIRSGSLTANKPVIEAMRACLIVIVAVIKEKEIDITYYLNKAEEFGKILLKKNIQV